MRRWGATISHPAAAGRPARPVISVRGLTKHYGQTHAVRGIDLEVRRGEILALLGPNGAGKTTTVEILEGFRRPTDGRVRVLGVDPAEAGGAWRNRVGVVLQESDPEPGLTVREHLRLYAGYYRAPRDIDDTIALVGLADQADTVAAQLSGGQRRRLDVALALIGDPELIFLDEPTTGFDPAARRSAWQVIAGLRALGKTVVLTTHYMDEAEQLADRIAVVAAGRIVADGTPQSLGGRDRMPATIGFTLPRRPGRRGPPRRAGSARRAGTRRPRAVAQPAPAATSAGAGRLGPGRRLRPARPGRASAHPGRRLPPPHQQGGTIMMLLIRWLARRLRARRAGRPDAGRPDAGRPGAAASAAARPGPPSGGKGPLGLVAHQVRYNLVPLTRSRQGGLVAAIGFPVIFLVLFVGVFGNHPVGADHVQAATYYVPGIAALAVVVACFANLVTTLVSQRESDILRRRRATPVPAQVLIAAQAATTLLVCLAGVAVLLGIGRLAYGVTLHRPAVLGVLLITLVGSAAFACLAYALSTAIGSVDSATPTVQAISLPLYFISGVFIPTADLPPWLQQVANVLPAEHLANGLHHAFDPAVHGTAVAWTDLAALAAWGAAGLAVALRRFSWSPSTVTT